MNYQSVDDVSILANPMGNELEVVTTQEAIKKLKELKLSVSTEERAQKQRVVTFNCTISGYNKLTVACVKFADRRLIQYSTSPHIMKLEDCLYIALYAYGMDEELLNESIYTEVIIPEVLKVRQGYLDDPSNQVAEFQTRYQFIAVAQDGANGQIKAIENTLFPWTEENNMDILWVKYAGGASLSQSPNDKGMMHSTLHSHFKSPNFHYGCAPEPEGGNWRRLKEILYQTLDTSSYKTVWKVIIHAPIFLDPAFNAAAILSGFQKTGIYCTDEQGTKYSPELILSHCPHWVNLSHEDATWVLYEKLPQLCQSFYENSYMREDAFDCLHERANIDNSKQENLNDYVTNRQRCLILGKSKLREHQKSCKS